MTLCKVTRLEVIDENGCAYHRVGVHVAVDLQDDLRTMKIFVRELPPNAAAEARAQYFSELAAAFGSITTSAGAVIMKPSPTAGNEAER